MAGADFTARLSVEAYRAAAFTANTAPVCLADTPPVGCIACNNVLQMAIAHLLTVLPEPTRGALFVAQLAGPTGRTGTVAIDRIANAPILATALLGAVAPKVVRVARPIALNSLPARCAHALARITLAGGPVHALTLLAAILAIGVVRARFFAAFTPETSNTQAGSIDV